MGYPVTLDHLAAAARALGMQVSQAANGQVMANGKPIGNPSELMPFAGPIPGVIFRPVLAAADGGEDPGTAPVLASLDRLWRDRLAATGWFTPRQVDTARALISAGVLVYPASAKSFVNLAPSLPVSLSVPPQTSGDAAALQKWADVVAAFDAPIRAYYRRAFEDARAQSEALEARAELWTRVYAVVEAVHEAPATIAKAAASSALDVAKGVVFNGPVLTLLALGAAGVAAWYFWPQLSRAALAKRSA